MHLLQWQTRRTTLELSDRGMVMGILNVTPDSFSDGGQHAGNLAVNHALRMQEEGAEIIDIGGESTRPGSTPICDEIEIERVIPVIESLRKVSDILISIDTSKAEVARHAIAAGADIVNDVSGCSDPEMANICAETGAGLVLMHKQGTPATMQQNPSYVDVISEVKDYFRARYESVLKQGVDANAIVFDPGIGFGKSQTHNCSLLHALGEISVHNRPILLGVSRKSLIGNTLNIERAEERDSATMALTIQARLKGCLLHRVHAVKENVEGLRMVEEVLRHA